MGPALRSSDLAAVREQLGREPTVPFSVVCRCASGHPLVIRNATRDADGNPFPTTFWLTCPDAVTAVSRLESGGEIQRLNTRNDEDAAFHDAVERAHRDAAAVRAETDPEADAWGGVGGTRRGLKCLHAHYAHFLAGGDDEVGAIVAHAVEPIHPERADAGRLALVDQGTHTCRLLVVERGPDGEPIELATDMVITKLGEHVDATGRLEPAALARTEEVLERFARRARALGAGAITVTATSAVRDSADREAFISIVRAHAGSDPRVIDGDKEGRLSFLGGTRGLEVATGPFLLLDIGGGSTELVSGREPGRAERVVSTQMGSVRLTERHLASDPPTDAELDATRRAIDRLLDDAELALPELHAARTLVAVSGTATTVQAIALDLARDDPDAIHRTWLTLADAVRVVEALASMTTAERAAIPTMAPGRADVIVAGGLILVGTMSRFGIERALVSETDILLGLALDALGVG